MSNIAELTVLPDHGELQKYFLNNPVPTNDLERVPYFSDLAERVIEHSDEVKEFINKTVRNQTPETSELDDSVIEDMINEVCGGNEDNEDV